MGVPAAMENLDVAHAALGQAAGVQATRGERARRLGVIAVELEGRVGFLAQVHQLRHRRLHAKGHLVLLDAREHRRVGEAFVLSVVQRGECIELGAAIRARHAGGVVQIQNRVALAAQQNALMLRRHEARAPQSAKQTLLRVLRPRVHHHVVRQIFVHAAEAVAEPRAEARPTGDLAAGLDVRNRRVMINRLGKRRVHHAQILGHRRGVRQQLAYPHAVGVVFPAW